MLGEDRLEIARRHDEILVRRPTTMRPAISREKNTVIATKKKYSASTRGAIVDARSGKSGRLGNIGAWCLAPHVACRLVLFVAAQHDHDKCAERENGGGTADAHGPLCPD